MADVVALPPIYGLLAEFESPQALVTAAAKTRDAGFRRIDAFSPFPIEELSEAIGFRDRRLPLFVLIGGLCGMVGGLGLEYWVSAMAYPMNVGGRPYASWPSFVPVAFETTILLAAFSAVIGMLVLNGLPMPYHPVFNAPRFSAASRDRFFLLVEAADPKFDRVQTKEFLGGLHAREVTELAH
ncbi:MAG TPA: DUF3341 domain-containing protein [Vicinamibacterales bacterium]|nr:DUF3341 domain-containing protein [Vicinamibacterales bacterium]